ncbi:MAG: adenosylcobinamide-GDP ribazoletransferase [Hyphomicrobiales bacterium]|nr:adenosylcobinamide-GDP ribazoletransferase [Hyphomicrobiales bacterium]
MNFGNAVRRETAALIDDGRVSLAFLTRLPPALVGGDPAEVPHFARAARIFPVVGAVIGLVGGLVLVAATLLGVPASIAAALAVVATLVLTGGLHEDGLADTFDGFGGGGTQDRKLEIMRDSRLGTYGAAALVMSILIRVLALGTLASGEPWRAAMVLVAAEAASRAALLYPWFALPAARSDGLAHDTGPPTAKALVTAQILAITIILVTVWPSAGLRAATDGILLLLAATYILVLTARAQIGGRTGDTLGACQQIAVTAFLIGATSAV